MADRIGDARLARVKEILQSTWSKSPPKTMAWAWIAAGLAIALFGLWWAYAVVASAISRYVFALFLLAAVFLVRQGLRRLQPTFAELVERDSRKPIIYLREFRLDRYSQTDPVRLTCRNMFAPGSERFETVEELVIGVIKEAGPCVCLGRPSDSIPELGATRLYTSDENWERVAALLLQDAQAAVFMVRDLAMSSALAKEWALAASLLPRHRLYVVLVTPAESIRGRDWDESHIRFMSHVGLSRVDLSIVRSPLVVYFDLRGHPRLLELPGDKAPFSYQEVFRVALEVTGMPVTSTAGAVRAQRLGIIWGLIGSAVAIYMLYRAAF